MNQRMTIKTGDELQQLFQATADLPGLEAMTGPQTLMFLASALGIRVTLPERTRVTELVYLLNDTTPHQRNTHVLTGDG